MGIRWAGDFYAQGFRYMQARDIYPGDDYMSSYVERVEQRTCQQRNDLGNGWVEVDGVHWRGDAGVWIRKHG